MASLMTSSKLCPSSLRKSRREKSENIIVAIKTIIVLKQLRKVSFSFSRLMTHCFNDGAPDLRSRG